MPSGVRGDRDTFACATGRKQALRKEGKMSRDIETHCHQWKIHSRRSCDNFLGMRGPLRLPKKKAVQGNNQRDSTQKLKPASTKSVDHRQCELRSLGGLVRGEENNTGKKPPRKGRNLLPPCNLGRRRTRPLDFKQPKKCLLLENSRLRCFGPSVFFSGVVLRLLGHG